LPCEYCIASSAIFVFIIAIIFALFIKYDPEEIDIVQEKQISQD